MNQIRATRTQDACLFCGSHAEVQKVPSSDVHAGPTLRISCRYCRPVDGRLYEISVDDAATIHRAWDSKRKDAISRILRSWDPERFQAEPQPIGLAYDREHDSVRVAGRRR